MTARLRSPELYTV